MDVFEVIKLATSVAVNGVLGTVVYILWKRDAVRERQLRDCLQSGGKITEPPLDEFGNQV